MGIREESFYEGGPHIGDLILNVLIGFTVIGLPLTVGAIVRALWLRYRITNRRVSVIGGWMGRDRTDVVYSEIVSIAKVPRGLGIWGDMVLTLKNGNRLELRAVPRFREIYDYISEKIAQKQGRAPGAIGQ
ncbi:PH domain-containing protein [Lyngbya sp. CCY1209]|uniref:PH domain-containing protein n=1 Tax=Lyngbya sp. CCY1209 TaxID=2886103 RepID=UPI002D20FEB2|nr:PH domain-containing protein [Lyngbya sp. CCY1209]MEB3882780.1 PH domain-containing protein [Lyngbya sp. CCY1209]